VLVEATRSWAARVAALDDLLSLVASMSDLLLFLNDTLQMDNTCSVLAVMSRIIRIKTYRLGDRRER